MPLSVEAALQLRVFDRTAVRVYAGQENMGRAVRLVHPVEIPDIAKFLSGGELLITAGLGLGRTPVEQRKSIQEISAAGASALVVELSGRAFSTMPPALIDEAQKLSFPLVGLSDEVAFVEVAAQAHEVISELANADLVTLEELNDEFIKLLLANASHISLTEALAHSIGLPVVVEDSSHEVVAYAGGTGKTDRLVGNWCFHSRAASHAADPAHGPLSPGEVPEQDAMCARRTIELKGEAWGWIHVLYGEGHFSSVHAAALSRAADAIAITLLGDRNRGARSSERQASLLNRLLSGDLSGDQFVDRALRIGRDLRDRPLIVAVVTKGGDTDSSADRLEAALRPLRVPLVQADLGEDLVAVIGLTRYIPVEQVTEHLDRARLTGGVSRTCTSEQLPQAVRQARTAATAASGQQILATVQFDRLGVLRLLVALDEGSELRRYVDDEIGPLLLHDAAEASPLLPTLRAYLACGGNKARTAEMLFVQRRTLYYRLDRINALLNRSLEDAEARTGLDMAVRGHDFLLTRDPQHVLGGK